MTELHPFGIKMQRSVKERVADFDEVAATSDPIGVDVKRAGDAIEDGMGDVMEEGLRDGGSIDKPVGVDVAGAIMTSVDPVYQATVARLDGIIKQCAAMQLALAKHKAQVEADLVSRDEYTRAVITNHGKFALAVETECKRIDDALAEIIKAHAGVT